MEKNLFGFMADYEIDLGKKYLVLHKEDFDKDEIIKYQVEMITSNNFHGIAGLTLREKNNEVKIYYNLNGMISLKNYLRKQKIDKYQFEFIVERIISILTDCNRYFLTDRSFVLNEDFIYINPKTKEISLVYVPIELDQDINYAFRELIINFLVNSANLDYQNNYVQRVLPLLKSDEFHTLKFASRLKELNNDSEVSQQPEQERDIYQNVHDYKSAKQHEILSVPNSELKAKKLAEKRQAGYFDSKIAAKGEKKSTLRLIVLSIIALFTSLTAVTSMFWGKLNFGGIIEKIVAGVLVIALAGGIYLVLKRVKSKRERDSNVKNELKNVKQFHKQINREIDREIHREINREINIAKETSIEKAPCELKSKIKLSNVEIEGETDETTLLEDISEPMLRAVKGIETILIDKELIIVGRNKELCDAVIQNKSIGRAHAEIRRNGDSFVVVDLDSRNGTYINSERLISNKEYILKGEDTIKFADMEYVFINKVLAKGVV